jgi:hypothetical protein
VRLPELNAEEFETLLIMCGYATGAAAEKGDSFFVDRFLRLVNKLNECNPQFVPYETRGDAGEDRRAEARCPRKLGGAERLDPGSDLNS